jgi:hypothetical protein
VVARRDGRHVAADLLDDACAFVAQDHRQRRLVLLVADDHVRVADAGGYHAHEYLIVARRFERCCFKLEWFAGFACNCGADGLALWACVVRHFRFLLLVGRRQLGEMVPPRWLL